MHRVECALDDPHVLTPPAPTLVPTAARSKARSEGRSEASSECVLRLRIQGEPIVADERRAILQVGK